MNSDSSDNWMPMDRDDLFEDLNVFTKYMHESQGLDKDLAAVMFEDLQETTEGRHNVIFVASNGTLSIKAIHVPQSALEGKIGPVLFPTANPQSIIAAFSRELIQQAVDVIDELQPGLADNAWAELLESMTDAITLEYEANPPTWEMGNLT